VSGTILITLPASIPIGPAPVSWSAWTRVMTGASSFSVAASRSSRSCRSGRNTPGDSGLRVAGGRAGCHCVRASQAGISLSFWSETSYLGGWPCARTHERSN
jgi:hypothetical protein